MLLLAEVNSNQDFLSQFFHRLNKGKITYCVLRNYEQLPEKVENDVDIWVKDEHRERLYSILKNLADTLHYTLDYTPRLTLIGEGDYFLIKEYMNSIYIIHIDCWTYIHWKGLPYIDLTVIEKYLNWYEKGFYVLSPGVMASIVLLKELLQHGKVKEKYKPIIREYSLKDGKAFLNSFYFYFGDKHSRLILGTAREGNWQALEKNVNSLRIVLLLKNLLHPISQYKRWLNYLSAQFRRFFINSRGLFIVIIGPDGSGKSTTANNLIHSDIKRLFLKKNYFHGHFQFLPELKKIVSFFKGQKLGTQSPENTHPVPSKPLGMLRSTIYPLYYGFNYFLGHYFMWKEKARAGLVIFDRYFYDYMIQRLYINCPRWVLYFISKIIPQPDILIYLGNNPETIYARKPELSFEEIKRQLKICECIISRFRNGYVIDAYVAPDEVVKNIQGIIIRRIRERQEIKL